MGLVIIKEIITLESAITSLLYSIPQQTAQQGAEREFFRISIAIISNSTLMPFFPQIIAQGEALTVAANKKN